MSSELKENWKEIPNCDGRHEISDKGKIRICLTQDFVKLHNDKDGYMLANLWFQRKHHTVKVHRLVAEAFIGKPKPGEVVCHKNNIRNDNRVENLEWGTMYHNQVEGKCPSLFKHGEKNPAAKISSDMVIKIRDMAKTGKYIHQEIANMFNLSRRNVGKIIQRTRWAHI